MTREEIWAVLFVSTAVELLLGWGYYAAMFLALTLGLLTDGKA